jgi:low temperature requirement protein LtrA
VLGAFLVGFVGIISLWWLYFVRYAEEGAQAIARSRDPARLGRAGYAYAHGIMVAGIIVIAVGIEMTMAHPNGATSIAGTAVVLGGPALYLAGNALFNYALARRTPWSRLGGIGAFVLLVPLASEVEPLVLAGASTVVTLALALATGSPRHASAGGVSPRG